MLKTISGVRKIRPINGQKLGKAPPQERLVHEGLHMKDRQIVKTTHGPLSPLFQNNL